MSLFLVLGREDTIHDCFYPEAKKRFSKYWVWIGLSLPYEMRMCKYRGSNALPEVCMKFRHLCAISS